MNGNRAFFLLIVVLVVSAASRGQVSESEPAFIYLRGFGTFERPANMEVVWKGDDGGTTRMFWNGSPNTISVVHVDLRTQSKEDNSTTRSAVDANMEFAVFDCDRADCGDSELINETRRVAPDEGIESGFLSFAKKHDPGFVKWRGFSMVTENGVDKICYEYMRSSSTKDEMVAGNCNWGYRHKLVVIDFAYPLVQERYWKEQFQRLGSSLRLDKNDDTRSRQDSSRDKH